MKVGLLFLLLLVMTSKAWGSIAVTIDNDIFTGADGSYTHGTEITWYDLNDAGIYFTGLRNQVYTPKDITVDENQPNDHPWCGVTTVFYEQARKQGHLYSKCGVEAGILGPSSKAREQQIWLHKLTGSDKPMGWDNQMKEEPVLNGYLDNRYRLGPMGIVEDWSMKPDLLYGGIVGTTDVNLYSGLGLRAGYQIPPDWPDETSQPGSPLPPKFFAYAVAEFKGFVVGHNATMGRSLFHGEDEEHHVDLKAIVGEAKGGLSLGYGWFSLTYLMILRTEEFEGQDGLPSWGEIRLTFGRPF